MVISLTPQWRAILPMLSVAVVGLLAAAIVALFIAHDAWLNRQMAQMGEIIRQNERVRLGVSDETSDGTAPAESEAN